MANQRQIIQTDQAPAAVGPYSQAVRWGELVYTAGQIALLPETGQLVEGGIEQQTAQVMENLSQILQAAGSSLTNVIKTTIFVTDMADFGAVNKVYGSYFPQRPPARSTVQVGALPLGALVEIEAVAAIHS